MYELRAAKRFFIIIIYHALQTFVSLFSFKLEDQERKEAEVMMEGEEEIRRRAKKRRNREKEEEGERSEEVDGGREEGEGGRDRRLEMAGRWSGRKIRL